MNRRGFLKTTAGAATAIPAFSLLVSCCGEEPVELDVLKYYVHYRADRTTYMHHLVVSVDEHNMIETCYYSDIPHKDPLVLEELKEDVRGYLKMTEAEREEHWGAIQERKKMEQEFEESWTEQ